MKEEDYLQAVDNQIKSAQLNADAGRLGLAQQDAIIEERERGMVYEQLSLDDVLDNIHHLLRGYLLKKDDKTGLTTWVEPTTNEMRILTDYGVNYVMGAIQWYLNKNTLLSNYDDKQIDAKMEDLATTMADDVFMEYDKMFLYPTLDDCKDEIRLRIKAKMNMRKFAMELMGEKADEAEIEKQIIKEMEGRIERELDVIRQQKIKNKLKRFDSLMRFIQDAIHSAYQRAWKGQERTTLRQHIHISENKGGGVQPMQQQQGFHPFGLFKPKQ